MSNEIRNIERQFNSQKQRLIRNLQTVEQRKRGQFNSVMKNFEAYKKRENILRQVESQTSQHLQQMNRHMDAMKRQDAEDKQKIRAMLSEIHRLKVEVPKIEKTVRKMAPQRNRLERHDKILTRKLAKITAKVVRVQKKKNRASLDLSDILAKERMLKQSRIQWANFKSRVAAATQDVTVKKR